MPFRVSLFWTQQSSLLGGWSENYWNTLTDRSVVEVKAEQLRVVADAVKAFPVYCPRFRLSDVNTFRNVKVVLTGANPGTPTTTNDADYLTTKLLTTFVGADGKTSQWFGGLMDADVSNSGRWVPKPGTVTRLGNYFNVLKTGANGWAIRILDPAVLPVNVLNINGTTGIVTTAANTIPDGAIVRIKGVKGMTVANGIWTVQKLSDVTFQLNGWTVTTLPFLKGKPTMRRQVYVFRTITDCIPVRTTGHRVGKPTGLLGGRRRRRAS